MYNQIFFDVTLLSIIFALSLVLISFYFHAQTLNTHYPDWIVHAFRIHSLQTYGFASWTHTWANGINLWQAYQFLPHMMTLVLMRATGESATRAMVVMTIILFVFLRMALYSIFRLLHFSHLTAFVSTLLSFDIAQYWGGVADFSLLFGFTFFPIVLYLWIKHYQGHLQYLFPYIIGVSFYMHAILGYLTVTLWCIGIIMSGEKLFSKKFALQFLIFLSTSILFWYPILFKSSYLYSNTVFATKYFLNLVISSYQYFGLSIFIIGAYVLACIRIFMPFPKGQQWVRTLFVFLSGYFLLIILGLTTDLPQALTQLQFTRGVTMLGLGILFVFAPVLEKMFTLRSHFVKAIIVFIFSIAVVEGMWFTSIYSSAPGPDMSDAVATYNKLHPNLHIADTRVWSSTIDLTSYYAPLTVRLPYSYMGHLDSNQIAPRISPLILYQPYTDAVPLANIERLNDYFRISGVRYIFFDETSPFTTTLLSTDTQMYKDLGSFQTTDTTEHIFEVPWTVRDAVAISPKDVNQLKTFPFTLKLAEVNDQIVLDAYVRTFANMLYAPENTPLTIQYPSAETLAITVPPHLNTRTLFVDESFDKGWQGAIQKKPVIIAPAGPNFMKITLPENTNGILVLKHSWPMWFYVGLFSIFFIPVYLVFLQCMKKVNMRYV